MYRELIDEYVRGGSKLRDAYRGLSREQLLAHPIPGTWSLHQIAIHMMDSDLIGSDRMKRVASMERPLLIGYDETAFNNLPGTNDLDVAVAIDLFDWNRKNTATILYQLPAATFDRYGIHSESGKVTLKELLEKYTHHLDYHLEFVAKKRSLLQA